VACLTGSSKLFARVRAAHWWCAASRVWQAEAVPRVTADMGRMAGSRNGRPCRTEGTICRCGTHSCRRRAEQPVSQAKQPGALRFELACRAGRHAVKPATASCPTLLAPANVSVHRQEQPARHARPVCGSAMPAVPPGTANDHELLNDFAGALEHPHPHRMFHLLAEHPANSSPPTRAGGYGTRRKGLPAAADRADCSLLSRPRGAQTGEHSARGACTSARRLVNGNTKMGFPQIPSKALLACLTA
jgi:hypothetical protein